MRTLVLLLSLILVPACYTSYDWQEAERGAASFAAKIPGSTGQVECAHVDSDRDGYCSCTVFMGNGVAPQQLDCGCPSKEPGAGCTREQATGCKPFNPLKSINLAPGK